MNFGEALELMKQGKKVQRKRWAPTSVCLYLKKLDNPLRQVFIIDSDFCQEEINLSTNDVLATDWEECPEYNGLLQLKVANNGLPPEFNSVWELKVSDGEALQGMLNRVINEAELQGIIDVKHPSQEAN